jgi:ferritin-like metal-binding protein YciE
MAHKTRPIRSAHRDSAQSKRRAASHARRRAGRRSPTGSARRSARPRPTEATHFIYMAGLRNAHAMEKEAEQIMRRQAERLDHYPEVLSRLRAHIRETEQQIKRLEVILDRHDQSHSTLKDMALQAIGNTLAVSHAMAEDEILKNTFANFAFENYEIAAYRALIALAEKQDDRKALAPLRSSLREEEGMASWIEKNLTKVTLTYVDREDRELEAAH